MNIGIAAAAPSPVCNRNTPPPANSTSSKPGQRREVDRTFVGKWKFLPQHLTHNTIATLLCTAREAETPFKFLENSAKNSLDYKTYHKLLCCCRALFESGSGGFVISFNLEYFKEMQRKNNFK